MNAKRTFEELILIYQTEPSLVDVFCEGPSDASIFRFFTEAIETRSTAVFSADQIEWPAGLGSQGGHRRRIVFLSNELASRNLNGICIIDKDLDTIEDKTPVNRNLARSDYSCVDMYGLDVDDICAYIYATFNLAISPDQLATVFEACKHLFVIRFLREIHCMGSASASADEIVTEPTTVAFSADRYLERCKQINGYDVRWDNVIHGHDNLFNGLDGDFRNYINVHDLGEILASIVRNLKSRSVSVSPDFVAKHCAYVLLSQRLFGYPLFSEISGRLAN